MSGGKWMYGLAHSKHLTSFYNDSTQSLWCSDCLWKAFFTTKCKYVTLVGWNESYQWHLQMGNKWKREGQRPDNTWKDSAQGTKLTRFTRELENLKLGISSMFWIPLGMQTLFSLPFELFARNSWTRNCFFHILVSQVAQGLTSGRCSINVCWI